jgi:hypothetical protein
MNSSVKNITIPANVTAIGNYAFYNLNTNMVFRGTVPPVLGLKALYKINKIYVLFSSLDAYKSAPSWADYVDKIIGD